MPSKPERSQCLSGHTVHAQRLYMGRMGRVERLHLLLRSRFQASPAWYKTGAIQWRHGVRGQGQERGQTMQHAALQQRRMYKWRLGSLVRLDGLLGHVRWRAQIAFPRPGTDRKTIAVPQRRATTSSLRCAATWRHASPTRIVSSGNGVHGPHAVALASESASAAGLW